MPTNMRSSWNGARYASARDLVRLSQVVMSSPSNSDAAAGLGLVDAGDQVEERRFAGAVRSDDARAPRLH